jgi:hypothetical protein
MRLDFALLADSATIAEDGKVDISGAGISHIVFPMVPATAPSLALVARLALEDEDFERLHRVHAEVQPRQAPSEPVVRVDSEMPARFTTREAHEGESQGVVLVVRFEGVRFSSYGVYDVALEVDGNRFVLLPLLVLPQEDPRQTRLARPATDHHA